MNTMLQFISTIILATLSCISVAAPSADLWERWAQYDANSTQAIDHSTWNDLLSRYVVRHDSGVNRFRYGKVSHEDGSKLMNYLNLLGNINISQYNRDVQRAYWINLYNALTVSVVLSNYPLRSIRDVSSGFFSAGPWKKKLIKIENETLSLDDIEHRILRPIWKDPRLHYAVNCASIGCPNLQNQAFTATNSEQLLDKAAREYINHPRGAKVDSDGRLQVSSIYIWFNDDFGGDEGVIRHLEQYAEPALANALKKTSEIDDHHYNWLLNSLVPVQTRKKKSVRLGS